jgi:molecular chaperone GrpE (heat shock protein)
MPFSMKRKRQKAFLHHPNSALREPSAVPLGVLNVQMRATREKLANLGSYLKELEKDQQSLQALWAEAWKERETSLNQYYDLLRSILDAYDLCSKYAETTPIFQEIHANFQRVLKKQGVFSLGTQPGDPFDAKLHECVETVSNASYSRGVITMVIMMGFSKSYPDGQIMLVRPSQVIVNLYEAAQESNQNSNHLNQEEESLP